ncbi:MAG: hypothetical protein H6599_11025 [Flavobacteriales bacterium]|nr:hypothetical protein [Flavobacteriales bacterium]
MGKETNTAPDTKVGFWSKRYNNFNVGILAMLVAVVTPFMLPILGSFLAPFLFVGGVYAVMRSDVKIHYRILIIVFFIIPLVIWWDLYVYGIFYFTKSVTEPAL